MKRAIQLGICLALAGIQCAGQAPAAAEAERQAALAFEQQGRSAEAEAAWRRMLKEQPGNPEPYARLGVLEARQEHYNEAVPLYRKALELNPSIPGVRLNLGLALFKDNQLKAAIAEFTLLLKRAPSDSAEAQRLNTLLGMAHYGLREYGRAIPYLREAAQHDAGNLPLRLTLAHSCLWSQDYKCVLEAYHEILMLDAESAEADILAGEALDEMKNTTGAIEKFRAAVKANPKEPDAHYGLGYLLWEQKAYDEAASEFQAELANSPGHIESMLYLADTEIELKHPEIAQPLLESVLRSDPNMQMAHLDLGIIYADAGRNDEALKELKTAEEMTPDDVKTHWRLGRLYRSMGKRDEAKAEFDKANSINRAADSAIVDKISGAHARGSAAQPEAAAPEK